MKTKIKGDTLAMAYSGGGRNGAYQVGVNQALCTELGFDDFRVIRGISTGSLNGVMMAMYAVTGDTKWLTQAQEIYSNVVNADILEPNSAIAEKFGEMGLLAYAMIAGESSLYRTDRLSDLIDRYMKTKDWKRLIECRHIDIGFGAVSLQTGKMRVFSNWDEGMTPDLLKKALLASASIPVVMNPIDIGDEQWVDGGVLDSSPIERVWESELIEGVDTVIAVDLTLGVDPTPTHGRFNTAIDVLKRTLDLLTGHVYTSDVEVSSLKNALSLFFLDNQRKQLPSNLVQSVNKWKFKPVVRIQPSRPLGNSLKFDPKEMRDLIRRGFRDTMKSVKR